MARDNADSRSLSSTFSSEGTFSFSDDESYGSNTEMEPLFSREAIGEFFSSLKMRRRPAGIHPLGTSVTDYPHHSRGDQAILPIDNDDKKIHSRQRSHSAIVYVSCVSTYLCLASFLIWLAVTLFYVPVGPPGSAQRKHKSSFSSYISDQLLPAEPRRKRRAKGGVEELPAGCEASPWQTENHPNCNPVHEVDLCETRRRQRQATGGVVGYLASGLWRSVWAVDRVDPDGSVEMMVLKIMERKHEVNPRNFDRHRRDALVMEQLTSSPNVVDIYGFCGNTVSTEFVSQPLDSLLQAQTQTSESRLHLALGVVRGLADIHEIPGGPIVHADIQARQFLITPDGNVKLNDFNRCRFMSHKSNGEVCKFRIPSSPGKARSPEEYLDSQLDEKLDVYSTANVLFNIVTRSQPWISLSKTLTVRNVKQGKKPEIGPQFQQKPVDIALAKLTLWAFEHDPVKRPSARDLVREIETLVDKFSSS